MSNKKQQLKELVERFSLYYNSGNFDLSAEASARTWIEKLLEVFDWDVSNPLEIGQESRITTDAIEKMDEIDSSHRTPDYSFHLGDNLLSYLDAKKTNVDLSTCKKSSFQIRSYGWSAGLSCCFITNFKEFAIYDTRYKPDKNHSPDTARIFFCTFDKFIENFDVLEKHLLRKNVQSRILDQLYSENEPVGTKTLDQDFAENLGQWRLKFAQEAFKNHPQFDVDVIAEQVQIILDRVVFLRVAEGKKVETHGQLLKLSEKKDSYKLFNALCDKKFSAKYGGFLFGKNKTKLVITIKDETFSLFLKSLYYPFPYKFEVIPTDLLGNMYEQYLGKKLSKEKGKIVDDFKEEYQKTKGAVYTPRYIVDLICEQTLLPLLNKKKLNSVLGLRVVDPSCGSGSFLLGVFDLLNNQAVEAIQSQKNLDKKYDDWFWIDPRKNKYFLKVKAKRHIINSCIFGVDIDEQAGEVARLSLALKALEGVENEPQLLDLNMKEPNILNSIGENIKIGNSLVGSDIIDIFPEIRNDESVLNNLRIFDWNSNKGFKKVFDEKGGFDAVVGNPPYIETKHYKEKMPYLSKLLSMTKDRYYQTAAGGKLDIAMPFIERGLTKLNPSGRLGYIVTNRFFKTDYGKATRQYLSENHYIEKIIDFGELKIFQNRSTYTSIFLMEKSGNLANLSYKKINTLKNIQFDLKKIVNDSNNWNTFSYKAVDSSIWNFEFPDLLVLKDSLLGRYSSFESTEEIQIKVGLQVLWDKAYHLKPIKISKNKLIAKNGLGMQVEIELDICKPTLCNDSFYCFRDGTPDVYVVFPYELINKKINGKLEKVENEITFSDMKKRFPLAHAYLSSIKKKLLENVSTIEDNERWHLYTYKKNIFSQAVPKMLFPSTITDTVACVDEIGDMYQDNARVFSIIVDNASVELYWAMACVFNSTLFNCLAKTTTNPLQEGHVQFNKQFVDPLPIPFADLKNGGSKIAKDLARIGKDIFNGLQRLRNEKSIHKRKSIILSLENYFNSMDLMVASDLYKLTAKEHSIVAKYPRKLDRVEYFEKFLEETA